ncbi:MAG: HAMP domain-containing protein, partial [Flavobacterium sp.]
MRQVLDDNTLPLDKNTKVIFAKELKNELNNITEHGEKEEVALLVMGYNRLISERVQPADFPLIEREIRRHLRNIEDINMQAIVRKHEAAKASVRKAALLLGLVGSFTFLILFSFMANFPGFVANPLRQLLDGIRQIGNRNYKLRLEFKNNDEFADLARAFNQMASKLNDWENSNLADVLSEKLRIEAIIGQMQDAIIGINEKEEVLFINAIAEKVLNLRGEDIIGQKAAELTGKNDLFNYIFQNNNPEKTLKIYANGKESYFQLEKREIIIPNYDISEESSVIKANKPVGTVYILKNITQFKELDEAKTNFIATVSHELKTPISSIKMSLKLLTDKRIGTMNTEQTGLVEQISEDSDRLLKITGELLDLSQVETGNIQLNFVPADPNKIINYAVNAVKFQAEQKNIQLEVISSNTIPQVNADIEKTAWVLINFLSNALRYSHEKSRVVILAIERDSSVEFSVQDSGKGIDEQYKLKLFERYFRVPTDGQNKSGSGLGLAISKDFIEAQNGTIGVESAIGEGSRFYFRLPLNS